MIENLLQIKIILCHWNFFNMIVFALKISGGGVWCMPAALLLKMY